MDFINIKNFILDFGGVLYEINHFAAFQSFFLLSKKPELFSNYSLTEYVNDELIIQFEKGLIDSDEFRKKAGEKLFLDDSDELFDKAFNATLINLKPDALECVQKLKQKGNVVLVSNTNQIHYNYFFKECEALFNLFDELYFSHLIGSRKPDKEIYDFILEKTGFVPNETLFIDDSIDNISAANDLGFVTYVIDGEHSLPDLVNKFLK